MGIPWLKNILGRTTFSNATSKGVRNSRFKEIGSEFIKGAKKWGWKDGGLSEDAYKTFSRPMTMGALAGGSAWTMSAVGGQMFPGTMEQQGSFTGSIFRGAMLGAGFGAMHGLGKSLGAAKFASRYKPITNTGSLIRKASDSWVTKGALMTVAAANSGQFSFTKPVNRGY